MESEATRKAVELCLLLAVGGPWPVRIRLRIFRGKSFQEVDNQSGALLSAAIEIAPTLSCLQISSIVDKLGFNIVPWFYCGKSNHILLLLMHRLELVTGQTHIVNLGHQNPFYTT